MVYSIYKLVHIAAVIIFLGNIITGLFWMHIAFKTMDIKIISHSINGVIKSDRLFTIPSVIIITIGGFMTAINGQIPILRTGWIFWSLILFTISGIAFAWKVVPLQNNLRRLTSVEKDSHKTNWEDLRRVYLQWEIWGFIALVTPLIAMVLMTLKIPI